MISAPRMLELIPPERGKLQRRPFGGFWECLSNEKESGDLENMHINRISN
jgi:hypothetical protein